MRKPRCLDRNRLLPSKIEEIQVVTAFFSYYSMFWCVGSHNSCQKGVGLYSCAKENVRHVSSIRNTSGVLCFCHSIDSIIKKRMI